MYRQQNKNPIRSRLLIRTCKTDRSTAYYWAPRTADIKAGCPIGREALGKNYGQACERARFLNLHLDEWRAGINAVKVPEAMPSFGSAEWLFNTYLNSSAFMNRVSERSKSVYRRALRRIEDIDTKNGDTVAALPALSISPGAVDKIYSRLREGRKRQANLSVDIARRAFDVVWRLYPAHVPEKNPWRGVECDLSRTAKPAARCEEAYKLAFELRAMGEPHLGAAALICFEWHQRPEHVRNGDITWQDYCPPSHPNSVQIRIAKTGAKDWIPLEQDGFALFSDPEAYLSDLPRVGLPIVLTAAHRGTARPCSAEYAQRKVREARRQAGLGDHVTLDSCRHGGLTELSNASLTESEITALSM
ncbi:MAG: hypothetical protein AAGD43_35405, partial [Pseudomonadota bacterium]